MKKRKFTWLVEIFKYGWQQITLKPILFVLILLALPIVFFIVYYTGGIKYVYSHTMYIAIILAGIYYGPVIATLDELQKLALTQYVEYMFESSDEDNKE